MSAAERLRPIFAYTGLVSSVGFAEPKKEHSGPDRYISTVAIIAGIFAAIRLERLPDSELSEPRLASTVKQGVLFARAVLAEAMR